MKILKNKGYGEIRIALIGKNGPEEITIRRNLALNFGDVVSAKIGAYHPVLHGYFAETSCGAIFLPTSEPLTTGQTVLAKITKEVRADKDATGLLVSDLEITPEPEGYDISDDEMDELIADAMQADVAFADGAKLHIEQTKVCWTIDVDSGKSTRPIREINQKSCSEIARQIHLKNMGGLILVDFAGSKYGQKQLAENLTQALASDSLVTIKGWTRAGLFEIERKRTRSDLWHSCSDKNPVAVYYQVRRAIGRFKSANPHVLVSPEVFNLLQKSDVRAKLEPIFDKPISYFEIKEK